MMSGGLEGKKVFVWLLFILERERERERKRERERERERQREREVLLLFEQMELVTGDDIRKVGGGGEGEGTD